MAHTTKRKRKYSQDFSGGSLTDQSFAPACDVNTIVRHYESTGLDPHADRKSQERFGDASTLTYEDAMRNKAELDSFQAENPDFLQNALAASEAAEAPQITPDAPVSEPPVTAPQDALGGDSE